jgi:hypothetical protein
MADTCKKCAKIREHCLKVMATEKAVFEKLTPEQSGCHFFSARYWFSAMAQNILAILNEQTELEKEKT